MRPASSSFCLAPRECRWAPADDRIEGRDLDRPVTEPELLLRVRSYLAADPRGRADPGLAAAWEAFSRALGPTIRSVARSGGRSGDDRADAEQEAWAALIARLPSHQHDPARGSFLAWASVVARHAVANFSRRQAAWRRLPPPPPVAEPASAADALERLERHERVCHALASFRAQVTPIAYWVVVLHWIAGQTAGEIASRLGLTHGQVVGHLNRSISKLRGCLGREVDPG